jgi:hypothetical protein
MHAVYSTSAEKDVISLTFHQTMPCTSIVVAAAVQILLLLLLLLLVVVSVVVVVVVVVAAAATGIYCGNINYKLISYRSLTGQVTGLEIVKRSDSQIHLLLETCRGGVFSMRYIRKKSLKVVPNFGHGCSSGRKSLPRRHKHRVNNRFRGFRHKQSNT